ncbi:hypothetical protein PRIPAC_87391 [Pristionchus pacificus]|nr:hypothetical protein PRIPAC_87391 [Pristionchus pacificus]
MDHTSELIWYKGAPDERHHVIPLESVYEWYNNHLIQLSARFSFDEGRTWDSIVELRRRNGPTFPFITKSETGEAESGWGGIAAAKKMLSMERAEVERLERARDELQREVEEQERMLERMKEIDKQLDQLKLQKTDKYSQIEGRMFKVAARLTDEGRAAQKEPVVGAVHPAERARLSTPESLVVDSGTARVAVTPQRIFPMLQASTLPNDYHASASILDLLRLQLQNGVRPSILVATAAMFAQPPTCLLCPGALPLVNLTSFLKHVLNEEHIGKVTSSGGKISAMQVFYWKSILDGGSIDCKPF